MKYKTTELYSNSEVLSFRMIICSECRRNEDDIIIDYFGNTSFRCRSSKEDVYACIDALKCDTD